MNDSSTTSWRCTVCGYIHAGTEPPEFCPICGASAADFEPSDQHTPSATVTTSDRWQCMNCRYIHSGAKPPRVCPVCGVAAERFDSVQAANESQATGTGERNIVIVGAGIAGVSAAETIRTISEDARITLISRESALPYYRLNLTRYLAGEITDDVLPIHPQAWYDVNRVELLKDAEVSSLSPENKTVGLRDGRDIAFDTLILAMGSHPFMPPFPGATRDGVTTLRTVDDAHRILDMVSPGQACVCVGGGVLGLETAGALAKQGADVTLLESHAWLMPRQLNREAGDRLKEHLSRIGIKLLTEARTEEIIGDERVRGVLLQDGSTVPADLVVIATGVRTNSYLARKAALDVNKGITVDNHLMTSATQLYAAGDVAEHDGMVYGSWSASQYQGRIAGTNAAGGSMLFAGIPRSHTIKVLDIDLVSIGKFEPDDGSFDVVESDTDDCYCRFVFHDGCMVGCVLLGEAAAGPLAKKAIETGRSFADLLATHPTALDIATTLKS